MIAGLERPTSGRILLDGVDVARVPPQKRNVNTVFQSYALFPHPNVAGNVAFGLKYQRVTKEERTNDARHTAVAVEQGTPVTLHLPSDCLRSLAPSPEP